MNKNQVQIWLDQKGYTFKTMSDDEKIEMRQALKICGAATSSSEYSFPCCVNRVYPSRCRVHGGATPVGPASPHWRTGRHSKYMPSDLLQKYSDSMSDPDLLALNSDIALMDARVADLLEKLDQGGGFEDWSEVSKLWKRMLQEQKRVNRAKTEDARASARETLGDTMQELNKVISNSHKNVAIWREIGDVIEIRRRLVGTEAKKLVDLQLMISAERATSLIYGLLDIVRRRVKDESILSEISKDTRKLITGDVRE